MVIATILDRGLRVFSLWLVEVHELVALCVPPIRCIYKTGCAKEVCHIWKNMYPKNQGTFARTVRFSIKYRRFLHLLQSASKPATDCARIEATTALQQTVRWRPSTTCFEGALMIPSACSVTPTTPATFDLCSMEAPSVV